jgi:ABC-2 type transport system permease protein
MSDIGLLGRQSAFVLRGYLRRPQSLVFGIAMPVALLVLFNAVFASGNQTTRLGGQRVDLAGYYTAGIVAYSIALSCFSSLLISIVTNREAGRLKRYRGTPMPPWVFLVAQIVECVLVAILMTAVVTLIGVVAYDVSIRAVALVAVAVYVVVGSFVGCTLGFALSRFVPTTEVASSVGPFSVVILGFVSGVFIPVATLPSWLAEIGKVFPLAPLATGLQHAFASLSGLGLEAEPLAVLAAWGIVSLAIAVRSFRWEPLTRAG